MSNNMFSSFFKKIITSVFTKLLLVTFVTVLLINITVGGLFWAYRIHVEGPLHANVLTYLQYVVEDIGTPPNKQRALEISQQTALKIHYLGPEAPWSTTSLPDLSKVRMHKVGNKDFFSFGKKHGDLYVKLIISNNEFLFELDDDYDDNYGENLTHIALFSIITLIIAMAYFVNKSILRQLKWLARGVEEVNQGNLSYNVPVKSCDELGSLAGSFNIMTNRIAKLMQSKERLLLDVSHELRSPITRLKVALEFLQSEDKKSLEPDILEMENMITSILNSARDQHSTGNLTCKSCDPTELLHTTLAKYKDSEPEIIFTPPSSPIKCNLDKEKCGSVLQNIIDNSLKYSNPASAPINVKIEEQDKYCVISIQDDGVGIGEHELAYVTEPFYRVDISRSKDTGGFGLGLSICKSIMEAHKGYLEISSPLNTGTLVKLYFPK